ncbi:MAG TPA: 2-hydroxyacid dehydrogenase [Actinomycetota bacterium]
MPGEESGGKTPSRLIGVGFKVAPETRAVIQASLEGAAEIAFLGDLDEAQRPHAAASVEALLTWNPWRELGDDGLAAFSTLRFMQLVSAGADHVRFADLSDSIVVASNPGAYAEPMAEHTVGMILALAKRLTHHHEQLARGEFDQRSRTIQIRGATCGILGFGGIGKATARLMRSFGARVAAINSSGQTDEPVDSIGTLHDLDEVLRRSDFMVIALPLTRRTRGLIGTRELELMKPDAILVNVARGAIVDEAALYRHVRDHPEFMVGIDTWWDEPRGGAPFETNHPFFKLPNVLGSPHNSALVPGIEAEAIKEATENLLRYLGGESPRGMVRREDYLP